MKYIILVGLIASIFINCSDPDAALRKELDTAVFKIDMLQQQLQSQSTAQSGDLVHIVYMNTRNDLTTEEKAKLSEDLNQLQGIPEIKSFSIGQYTDLGDQRAMSEYEVIMSMAFKDQAAYKIYQDHPTHIALKEKLGNYLSGPPATYDYIVK